MATIRFTVGKSEYGTIFRKDGSSSSTIFWHLNHFPLIPLGGRSIVDHDGARREESGFVLASLLLALFNAWGLVAVLVLGGLSWSHHGFGITVAAVVLMTLVFTSWFWGGGLWRFAEMKKRNLWFGSSLLVVAAVVSTTLVGSMLSHQRFVAETEAGAGWAKLSPEDRLKGLSALVGTMKTASEAGDRAQAKAECDAGKQAGCVALGKLYELGKDGPRDVAKAVALYQPACDAKELGGCARLGFLYRYGDGVKLDPVRAIQLLTPACDGGDGWACYHLGEMAAFGSGMPANPAAAAQFRQRGCQLGFAGACKK